MQNINTFLLILATIFARNSGAMENTIVVINDENTEHTLIAAKFELAKLLIAGQGGPQDYERAHGFLKEIVAAEFGRIRAELYALSHAYLAKIYEHGRGVKIDENLAKMHLSKALKISKALSYEALKQLLEILTDANEDGLIEIISELGIRIVGKWLLHAAAGKGFSEIVEALILKGANVHEVTESGSTALNLATSRGHKEVVEVLLSAGANVKTANWRGNVAVHFARTREIIELLVSKGASIDVVDDYGLSVLHFAARNSKAAVEFCLDKGLNVNVQSKDGLTPLHLADKREIVELLFLRGANINAADQNGDTVLHIATLVAKRDIVEFLISKGAHINAANKKGQTPLYYARDEKLVKILTSSGGVLVLDDAKK